MGRVKGKEDQNTIGREVLRAQRRFESLTGRNKERRRQEEKDKDKVGSWGRKRGQVRGGEGLKVYEEDTKGRGVGDG